MGYAKKDKTSCECINYIIQNLILHQWETDHIIEGIKYYPSVWWSTCGEKKPADRIFCKCENLLTFRFRKLDRLAKVHDKI